MTTSSIIVYFDAHSGAVQAIATLALVAITAVYAWLTWGIAKAAKEAQRPYVYVDISGEGSAMEFIVGNDGDRAAQDVRLTLEMKGSDEIRRQLLDLHPFKGGVAYLAPHRRYRYMLIVRDGSVFSEDRAEHVVMSIAARYRDAERTYDESVSIDVTALSGVLLSSFGDPVATVASEIKEIARILRSRDSEVVGFRRRQVPCPVCGRSISEHAWKCPECHEWIRGENALARDSGESGT